MAEPSAQDLYDAGRTVLLVRRPSLAVLPGDITDAQLWAMAAMGELVLLRGSELAAATYLSTSTGDALTQLALDHWDVERFEAVSAVGTVTFSRPSGAAGTIPAGTRVASSPAADGSFQVFTTNQDLVLGIDAGGSVGATAEKSGSAGNVAAAAVNRILSTLFDTDFTVTNAQIFAGGASEESDEDLRARVRGLTQALRRATVDALRYGALQVPTVQTASVVEGATGLVTVYVADSDGNSNAQMIADVLIELENWRAAGVPIQVSGGVPFSQAISVSLVVRAGVAVAALADRVRQAIISAVNQLDVGETLYRSLIQAAARAVDPTGILEVTVVTPGADIAPSASQVIRTNTGIVTVA